MSEVLLVTGGGRGIGAATARLAARYGYKVGLTYRQNSAAADQVVADVRSAGGHAIALSAEVGVESDVQRVFDHITDHLGTITALVNNAGILEKQMRVAQMDVDRWQRVFATNVLGTFLYSREAVRRMSTAFGGKGGAIVNLSSVAARLGAPREYVDYAASKGAIEAFTIGLAKEVAADGIRVNAVRPGIIDTEIHASGGEPNRVERMKTSIPIQRGGQAEEVAQAILWLLSDKASYVTGTCIDVSGGRYP